MLPYTVHESVPGAQVLRQLTRAEWELGKSWSRPQPTSGQAVVVDRTSDFHTMRIASRKRRASSSSPSSSPSSSSSAFASASGSDVEMGLIASSSSSSSVVHVPNHVLPSVWVEIADPAREATVKLDGMIAELKKLHAQRQASAFRDPDPALLQSIENVNKKIRASIRKIEEALKTMMTIDLNNSPTEQRVRAQVFATLQRQLAQSFASYQAANRDHVRKLKEREATGSEAFAFLSDTPSSSSAASSSYSTQSLGDVGFTSAQLAVVDETAAIAEERDAEIQRIAKSVVELNDTFKELATIVYSQGTILDRIDFNMEAAVNDTRKGNENLEKAQEYQKRPIWLYASCILVVFVLVLLAILVLKLRK